MGQIKNIKLHIVTDIKVRVYGEGMVACVTQPPLVQIFLTWLIILIWG